MPEETSLTIYLIRTDQIAAFESATLPTNGTALLLLPPLDGVFVPLPAAIHTPPWVPTIQSVLQQPEALSLQAQAPAGLMVIRRAGRTFVITFGHAWLRLDDHWLEREFGRRVALNAIDRDQVIEIRAEQVFAKWHLASERAPRASAVEEFNVEFDRDLVASVSGIPNKSLLLGTSLRGATSLRIKIPFGELSSALDSATHLFSSDQYKKAWPEVDNIAPIDDLVLIQRLETQLNADLNSLEARKRIVMFTPSQRRDEDVAIESYVYGRLSKNPAMRPYLSIESWIGFLDGTHAAPSVNEAKISKIHLMDEHKEEIKSCTAFDCFGYETSFEGKPYFLSSGQWYVVTAEFLKVVNGAISKIATTEATLPKWDGAIKEPAYNRAFGKMSGNLYFDAKPVFYGGGRSKFEFCDVCNMKKKRLFFVKNPSKSSGMSHLLEQVRRTSELFFNTDSTYRKELRNVFHRVAKDTDTQWLLSRPQNGDWELSMVGMGRLAKQLPFFAKCGLFRLHKDLTERGHKVTYTAV